MINQKGFTHIIIAIVAFTAAAVVFVGVWWFIFGRSDDANTNTNTTVTINSFVECEEAGYPVMESYPRQCAAGGKTFTEVIVVDTNRSIDDMNSCRNSKQGYQISYPKDWKVWKSAQGEAMLTTCEAGDPIIFFAPKLSDSVDDQIEFNIEALNSERREGTDYEGVDSLEGYLAINPPVIEKELTVDDQRMVQIGSDYYVTYYDGVIYLISTSNLSESEKNLFFESIEFSSTNWQPFDSLSSGWLTYTNQESAFSINYPNTWELDLSSGNPVMFMDERALAQEVQTEMMQGSKVEIWWGGNGAATVAEAVDDMNSDSTVITENNVTVDGLTAIRQTGEDVFGAYNNRLYILNDGRLYSIVQYIPEDEFQGSYTEIYEGMINTFQFTE